MGHEDNGFDILGMNNDCDSRLNKLIPINNIGYNPIIPDENFSDEPKKNNGVERNTLQI